MMLHSKVTNERIRKRESTDLSSIVSSTYGVLIPIRVAVTLVAVVCLIRDVISLLMF
jgi:hypothetical protein